MSDLKKIYESVRKIEKHLVGCISDKELEQKQFIKNEESLWDVKVWERNKTTNEEKLIRTFAIDRNFKSMYSSVDGILIELGAKVKGQEMPISIFKEGFVVKYEQIEYEFIYVEI